MKKQLIGLLFTAVAFPVLAQNTNELHQPPPGDRRESVEKKRKHSEWTEQQRKEHRERRYQFMDKALSNIGVSDEDKVKLRKLQEIHRKKMKENSESGIDARKKLSDLQEKGATEEEMDIAIQNLADTMAEQLRILVRNRMEMEKILGKEKYVRLMENARTQFHKHGRRSGSGMPPRPGLPPIPGEGKGSKPSPMPNAQPQLPPPPAP